MSPDVEKNGITGDPTQAIGEAAHAYLESLETEEVKKHKPASSSWLKYVVLLAGLVPILWFLLN